MDTKKYYEIELFHWAGMLSDNVAQIKDIVQSHPEYLFATNKLGDNCLLVAIQSGNINIVKYLINETDIDLNFQFIDRFELPGDNALMCSVVNNKKEITEFILENTNIKIDAVNAKGKTVYHLAAFNGDADLIEKLINLDDNRNINNLDRNNQHCLYDFIDNYIKTKDLWCLEVLLENMELNTINNKNKEELTIADYIEKKMKENPLTIRDYNPVLHLILDRINSFKT